MACQSWILGGAAYLACLEGRYAATHRWFESSRIRHDIAAWLNGTAPVSKTGNCRFESCRRCQR